jgi:non-heme Fe2+,alpha-ketoglutarate-dependent halogenase
MTVRRGEGVPKKLTRLQLDAYRRDGVLFPVAVLSHPEVAAARASLEEVLESHRDDPDLPGYLYDKTHLLMPWFHDLVRRPAILDAVEDVLGPDLLLWSSSILIKRPGTATYFTWHQDATYWFLDPPVACTAWLALSPATVESGCMRAIPGTHKLGQLPHADTFDKDVMLLRGQRVSVPLPEDSAVDVVLRPGEMALHDIYVVHGSSPNRSHDLRIGCTMQFIPTHVRQSRGRECASLVRGVDRYRHFDPETAPRASLDAAAIAAHRAATGRMQTYNAADRRLGAPGNP